MNWLKYNVFFVLVLIAVACLSGTTQAADLKGATVTIYNKGTALIEDVRSVTLPKGPASVVIKGVPETLDPTSLRAEAPGMTVLDLAYRYLPASRANLLDRYVGRELTVIMPDPTDAEARTLRKATLLSNHDGPVFQVGNEIYVGDYEALLLPELPADLQQEPTLTLTTDNAAQGRKSVRLGYLMSGLSWQADYALTVDRDGQRAKLDAWATVSNDTRGGFTGADIRLVAGDVQRDRTPRPMLMGVRAKGMAMNDEAATAPRQESFSQYHVYSLARPVNLGARSTRQISLFAAPNLGVSQTLISRFHGSLGQMRGSVDQTVTSELAFANTGKNGLGRPMPAGLMRVFMPTTDGVQLLAGESRIKHTGPGGEVRLTLGSAFDVAVSRTQTAYRKLGKNSFETAWRIEIVNGRTTPQQLTLADGYAGQWQVVAADKPYTMPDAGTLQFQLTVPPTPDGKPVTVSYTVQVTR